jgi:magnesium-transporting ATPase (P-type)
VVTGALQHWVDTGVILAVVLANAVIGFMQEGKAEARWPRSAMLAPRAAVLRDGRRVTVDGADLVPGDIVLLEAGDKVPADLRVIEARGLAAQEAILTGESVPVEKAVSPSRRCAAGRPPVDAVVGHAGHPRHRARAGGGHRPRDRDRPHRRASGRGRAADDAACRADGPFRALAVVPDPAGRGTAAGLWLFRRPHAEFSDLFMAVVGVAVAAIPEGLPAVMTITLAIGVQAMARRNAIVRRLPAIEAIGSVSVICTDKTGTLTRNEMVVAAAETPEGSFAITGEGYAPEGAITPPGDLSRLARAAALCNDAALHDRNGVWTVEGDPMEGALLAFAGKVGRDRPARGWTPSPSTAATASWRC